MNPPWDSKYTTNINLEMNYWPAEVANLAETAQPLFRMIREVDRPGHRRRPRTLRRPRLGAPPEHRHLARRGADGRPELGRVHDRRRVALHAPLGALPLHRRRGFLREYYPVMKGAAEFFLDFLVQRSARAAGSSPTRPRRPRTSRSRRATTPFFDEVTGSMSTGTTLAAGSTIDTQILCDLFARRGRSGAPCWAWTADFRRELLETRARLAPMQVGRSGRAPGVARGLGPAREEPSPHLPPLRALSRQPDLGARGRPRSPRPRGASWSSAASTGNGWSSAWKAAAWARLGNASAGARELHLRDPPTTRPTACSRSARGTPAGRRRIRHDGGDRRDAPAVARERARRCCRRCRRPGATARSRGCARAAATRSVSPGRTARSREATVAATKRRNLPRAGDGGLQRDLGGQGDPDLASGAERDGVPHDRPGAVYALDSDPRK